MNIIKGCLYLNKKRYEMSKNINEKDLEIKDRILFETHKKENIDYYEITKKIKLYIYCAIMPCRLR